MWRLRVQASRQMQILKEENKMQKNTGKIFHTLVHILEYAIAVLTIIVLLGLIGLEIYKMFTVEGYFDTADTYLQNILTIVVGLEFVRMLINLTPANTLEVLIVAIARQVIVNHDSVISNVSCVICIGGLFAIRKFLISKKDLSRELSEPEADAHANKTEADE